MGTPMVMCLSWSHTEKAFGNYCAMWASDQKMEDIAIPTIFSTSTPKGLLLVGIQHRGGLVLVVQQLQIGIAILGLHLRGRRQESKRLRVDAARCFWRQAPWSPMEKRVWREFLPRALARL